MEYISSGSSCSADTPFARSCCHTSLKVVAHVLIKLIYFSHNLSKVLILVALPLVHFSAGLFDVWKFVFQPGY